MRWFTKEAPLLVRFHDNNYAVRRKPRFKPYEYMSAQGAYWFSWPEHVLSNCLMSKADAMRKIDFISRFGDGGDLA
jgi:hypothetical protein